MAVSDACRQAVHGPPAGAVSPLQISSRLTVSINGKYWDAGTRVSPSPQRKPDLLDPFPHPTTCVNQLLDGSGIEGRVVDLVFATME